MRSLVKHTLQEMFICFVRTDGGTVRETLVEEGDSRTIVSNG